MSIAYDLTAQETEFLRKYSYICTTVGDRVIPSATCFFIKNKSKIYLVSNYHVFYGTDERGNKHFKVDSIRVGYISSKTRDQKFLIVPIKDKSTGLPYYESGDIEAYEVDIPKDFKVNLTNDLIDHFYFNKIPDRTYYYGYPSSKQTFINIDKIGTSQILSEGMYIEGFKDILSGNYLPPMTITYQKLDEIQKSMNRMLFETGSAGEVGVSGSPVFGQFHDGKKITFKFIGIVIASSTNLNRSQVLRADYVINFLNEK